MIYIGYPGIDKTTVAKKYMSLIDLESSHFYVNGVRHDDWYVPYCNIAKDLSDNCYDVFVSTHKEVRQELLKYEDEVCIIMPDLSLGDEWITKLAVRYNMTSSSKDYKAFIYAKDNYYQNIRELMLEPFKRIIIKHMNYDLADEILKFEQENLMEVRLKKDFDI